MRQEAALIFAIFGLGLPCAQAALTPPPNHPFHVVLDPGHGGIDHGTFYTDGRFEISEKNATLMLARQLADELRSRGMRVTLTRDDDSEVSLGERTALANRLQADIFLSIHMNSSEDANPTAEGVESFILNNTTDNSTRRLAHLENTVIDRRGVDTPEQRDVALILRDLRLDANLPESKRLACSIQQGVIQQTVRRDHFNRGEVRDRGVKQALFHVLLGAEMPSVLFEAGFLSSAADRAAVITLQGRRRLAQAMARSIDLFRRNSGHPEATAALSRCQIR